MGEDMRFAAFLPRNFSYAGYSPFNYSARLFFDDRAETYPYNGNSKIEPSEKMNITLWKKRCSNTTADSIIYNAVYLLKDSCYHDRQSNPFIKYLFDNHDTEAITYLDFARACGQFNEFISDPWERQEIVNVPQRKKMIELALKRMAVIKDEDIKIRYGFLITRLAYYNGNHDMIKNVYEKYFINRQNKNIIDYWAMYFRAVIEPKSAFLNYYASIVFANAVDKRFMINFQYNREIPIAQTLAFAKTKKEQAAIWLLDGIKNPGHAMKSIEAVYKLDPHQDGLSFLLLREINKLEDWIFTPYYTNYPPSLDENTSVNQMLARISRDKEYATALLNFIGNMDLKKTENPQLIKISMAYLQYMNNDYVSCLNTIKLVKKHFKMENGARDQLEIITALCLNARQEKDHAVILDSVKPVLMRQFNAKNYKFVFAIARELEFKGNTTDAAMLLSKLNQGENKWENTVYWKIKKRNRYSFEDYYEDYFIYLDAQYSSIQLKKLISRLEDDRSRDSFSIWKMKDILPDLPGLYDLLGTKYLRENDLGNALRSFEKVKDLTPSSDKYGYPADLDGNPFYTNFYAEQEATKADSLHFTKAGLVKTLISYLQKAEDINNKQRSLYYFLAGNCYLNMTQHGNSWMMRRYSWSSDWGRQQKSIPDNEEYFSCGYAKQYYLKAGEQTKSSKFRALCLRMAGRCEKYRLQYYYYKLDVAGIHIDADVFKINKYYRQLKKRYPDYYDELIDNCESFEKYFNVRR
jgi:hypothetical protein